MYLKLKEETMGKRIDSPDKLKDCFVEAACAARSVMLRDHIVPERVVRVGEFITSLRRSMAYYSGDDKNSLVSILTDSGMWSDILQLKDRKGAYNFMSSAKIDYMSELESIIELAILEMEESNPKMIESNLDDMLRQMDSLDTCVNRAIEINREADVVVDDFDKLLKEMAVS